MQRIENRIYKMITKAIQELKAENNELKARIEVLESK